MTTLKALLIGVTRYSNAAPSPAISIHRPWAALDVEAMLSLVETLVPGALITSAAPATAGAFDTVEAVPLIGEAETKLSNLQAGLKWLWQAPEASRDAVHRLFYFSGHGMLVPSADGTALEEVLLPSDTDWTLAAPTSVRDADLLPRTKPRGGASLEVMLETCSASVFAIGTTHPLPPLRPFGCRFRGSVVVWAASQIQQHSHSGPVPPCEAGPIRGLFTHFFCKHFPMLPAKGSKASRQQLLDNVDRELQAYGRKFSECCECCEDFEQVPALFCPDDEAESRPLSGSAAGASPALLKKDCAKPHQPGEPVLEHE